MLEGLKPKNLLKENLLLREKDIEFFNKSSLPWISVPCPCCDSDKNDRQFQKQGYNFDLCKDCGTLYVNPRPSKIDLQRFYKEALYIKHWNQHIFPNTEEVRIRTIVIPMLVFMCKYIERNIRRIADMGAGSGLFCKIAKNILKTDVVAVDLSSIPGVKTICKDVVDLTQDEMQGVDIITAFEILEHVFDPSEFLRKCREILPSGGLLFLSTVNIRGFDMSSLGYLCDNIIAPIHLNYFTPDSLKYLLMECGFEIIEIKTPGRLDVENVKNKLSQLNIPPYSFYNLICSESLSDKFQEFLRNNLLSSHLVAVARVCP